MFDFQQHFQLGTVYRGNQTFPDTYEPVELLHLVMMEIGGLQTTGGFSAVLRANPQSHVS